MPPTTSRACRSARTTRRRGHAAIEALLLVAEHGGPTMMARIGVMRALYPDEPVMGPRKKTEKKYRIVG
jgi:hypothetical protein